MNIEELVKAYKSDQLTWHDIQDLIESYVMQQDGKGMTLDINIIQKRAIKTNKILEKIERRLKK